MDIHHLAGVGPMCVFAVPLTLNNCGTGSLKQGPLAVSGLIDLGNDSLLTGSASNKLRASVYPAARPSSEMTVHQTRLTVLTLYGVFRIKPLCLPATWASRRSDSDKPHIGLNPAASQMFGGEGPSPLTFYR